MRFAYVYLLLTLSVVLACNKEEEQPDPVESITPCTEITLEKTSYFPLDSIVPISTSRSLDNLSGAFYFEGEPTGVSFKLENGDGQKNFIPAPYHPISPADGGSLSLVFTDNSGDAVCDPLEINIQKLPESENYTQDVIGKLIALLDRQVEALGFDPDVLNGDFANLDDGLVPFALAKEMLVSSGEDFGLLSFLENEAFLGESNFEKQELVRLSDQILARVDFLSLLESESIQAISTQKEVTKSLKQARRKASICDGMDAQELAKQMKLVEFAESRLDPTTAEGAKLQKASDASVLAGIIPGVGTAAGLVGASLFVYKKIYEGTSKVYMSKFEKIDYKVPKTTFLEETACSPFSYSDVLVDASNKGWVVDKSIWESLFQVLGILASRVNVKSGLSQIDFDASVALTSKQLDNLSAKGNYDGSQFKVERAVCSNIDISDGEYAYAKIIGDAFSVIPNSNQIEPEKAGLADLEIGARSSVFGGQTISETKALQTREVQVSWKPNRVRVKPGDDVDLAVDLYNAVDKGLVIDSEKGVTIPKNFEDLGIDNAIRQNFKHSTPSDPEVYPYTITATHSSRACLRGKANAEERFDIISVIAGPTLQVISLETGCLEIGSQRDFDVIVSGVSEDVDWKAQNGNEQTFPISSQGLFTAPEETGEYYIIATSREDPELSDTLAVEVGTCFCSWDLVAGGIVMSGDDASFNKVTIPNTIVLSFDQNTDNQGTGSLQFPSSNFPADGETKTFQLTQNDDEPWVMSFVKGEDFLAGPSPEDSDGNSEPGPTGVSVTLTLNGTRLEGTISGNAVLINLTSGSTRIVTLDVKFNGEEIDFARGLFGCD